MVRQESRVGQLTSDRSNMLRGFYSDTTQLHSTRRRVELSCVAINTPLRCASLSGTQCTNSSDGCLQHLTVVLLTTRESRSNTWKCAIISKVRVNTPGYGSRYGLKMVPLNSWDRVSYSCSIVFYDALFSHNSQTWPTNQQVNVTTPSIAICASCYSERDAY